jgi:hypothetical protein
MPRKKPSLMDCKIHGADLKRPTGGRVRIETKNSYQTMLSVSWATRTAQRAEKSAPAFNQAPKGIPNRVFLKAGVSAVTLLPPS